MAFETLLRPVIASQAGSGPSGRLSILIFHRVLAQADPLFPDEVDASRFDAICGWLASWFQVLPLDEAVARLREGTLPGRAACITFDDGYADNHDIALPILQRHRLPATFFIATGYLNGGRMFNDTLIEAVRRAPGPVLDLRPLGLPQLGEVPLNDIPARRKAVGRIIDALKYLPQDRRDALSREVAARSGSRLPDDLMMTAEQVRGLRRGGMQIGAHTVSHPILARLDAEAARREIVLGKRDLEDLLGAPVTLFAYPNGKPGEDYAPVNVEMVRAAGFEAAVSTHWGASNQQTDPFQLPRFTPWDRTPLRFGLRLAMNLRRVG